MLPAPVRCSLAALTGDPKMEDRLPALVRPRGDIAWPCSPFPVCPSALQLCTHFRPFDTYYSRSTAKKRTQELKQQHQQQD